MGLSARKGLQGVPGTALTPLHHEGMAGLSQRGNWDFESGVPSTKTTVIGAFQCPFGSELVGAATELPHRLLALAFPHYGPSKHCQ